ncbi:MAG: LamG domain-containing protein [Nitrosomonas sp.]|nr:LamG domain-containing protein [Nitrosomonas sp.]
MKRAHQVLLALLLGTSLTPTQAELVGYWGFEEGGGTTIVDSSGTGNNGTLINGDSARVAGKVGDALYFGGTVGPSSTRVVIPDNSTLDLSTALTFSAWVKSDVPWDDEPIFAKEGPGSGDFAYWFGVYDGGYGMLLDFDGNPDTWTTANSYRSVDTVTAGVWTFLTTTWDGNTISYYKNGDFLTSLPFSGGPIHNSAEDLVIGINADWIYVYPTAFNGTIDEVRVYNNALSGAEVAALYNLSPVPEPEIYSMLLAGLGLLGFMARRRKESAV